MTETGKLEALCKIASYEHAYKTVRIPNALRKQFGGAAFKTERVQGRPNGELPANLTTATGKKGGGDYDSLQFKTWADYSNPFPTIRNGYVFTRIGPRRVEDVLSGRHSYRSVR